MAKTILKQSLAPNQVRAFDIQNRSEKEIKALDYLGVSMDASSLKGISDYLYGNAMDAAPALQTAPSIGNPVQFFQYWVPEAVDVVTAARAIDDIIGRDIEGSFEDEEIVTRILERTGDAQPYTDDANIPFSSWNQNYETRTIVRFEEGLKIGYLEEMRAARTLVDDHKEKAAAAAETLAIALNDVGFYGYNGGRNKTYGFLNDPALPAYTTVAAGADTTWASKTFDQITADIITAVGALQNQLKGLFKPNKDAFTIAYSLEVEQQLYKMNSLGTKSVLTWIKETYPNARLEAAVELNGANGGSNIFYVFADRVNGKKTFKQSVQDTFRLLGVEKRIKVFVEDYAATTAGVICQYPIGVVRYSGI